MTPCHGVASSRLVKVARYQKTIREGEPTMRLWLILTFLLTALPAPLSAHPVLSGNHDRALLVRLTPAGILVSYRMEVNSAWVASWEVPRMPDLHEDLKRDPSSVYTLYRKYLTDSVQHNLVARLDGRELPLTLVEGRQELVDALRCEYTFRAIGIYRPDKRITSSSKISPTLRTKGYSSLR